MITSRSDRGGTRKAGRVRALKDSLTALPAPSTSLVGREDDLDALLALSTRHRVVTVVGPGGIGKTRVAIAAAHVLAAQGRRVGFIALADVANARRVVDVLADQLGVEVAPAASRHDGLVRWLAAAPTTLVVDNFEQVSAAAGALAAIVGQCPQLHLVVTSRRALDLRDEQVLTLRPLAATVPSPGVVAPGVRLLVERAGIAAPSPRELDAAKKIVAGVGGLPLAIELAAFRVRSLGAEAVHELLVVDLALDGLEAPGVERGRHASLRRCIEWTYRDLDASARVAFHATGAFAGAFDLAALQAVVGDRRVAAAGLAALVEHHLVDRVAGDDDTVRYVSIPPIHEYARELLTGDPRRDEVIDSHARHYGAVAARLRESFDCTDPEAALAGFRHEQANIHAAIGSRRRAGQLADAATISGDVAKIASELGRQGRVNEWFGDLAREAADSGVELPFEAQVWAASAQLAAHSPATAPVALSALDAVITAARGAGDDRAVLLGLDRMALSVVAHGDVARAAAASREGIELATRLDLQRPRAQFLLWRAMLAHIAGDLAGAQELGLEALGLARRLGDRRLIVRTGLLFAPMAPTSQVDVALVPSLPECLELARAAGSRIDEMYVVMQLAIGAGFDGRREVFDLARQGLDLADRTRSRTAELVFVLAIAAGAFAAGDDDVARQLDATLRPEWATLATVIPPATLQRYAQIVDRERSLPVRIDATAAVAGAGGWQETVAAARRYAARPVAVEANPANGHPALSARERDVLRELAAGRTNKEIADVLGMRPKTVMHHCAAIYRKLGVKTRAEATATALRNELLDPAC